MVWFGGELGERLDLGERFDCAKVKGAGTDLRLPNEAFGGLGKLPASIVGVGLIMARDGALGAASAGGGETIVLITEICFGRCFSILKTWTDASLGDTSNICGGGSVRGV